MLRKSTQILLAIGLTLVLGGTAVAQGPRPQSSDPFWNATYFNNQSLSWPPILQRNDVNINFNWGLGSPDPVVTPDHFSARWGRVIDTGSGLYRFTATSDDGIRVWVEGDLIIDQWNDHSPTTYVANKLLYAGHKFVQVEYYENSGGAVAKLSWAPIAQAGVVIVDDRSPGFVLGGNVGSWRSVNEGWGGHLFWTWNNDFAHPGYNFARWYPTLAQGDYEVFAHIPDHFSTTSNARYWVRHGGDFTLHPVDQNLPGPYWASLGTFGFSGDGSDYVSLSDVTFETRLSRMVVFDAMKWEPR
jgi:PA14 domain